MTMMRDGKVTRWVLVIATFLYPGIISAQPCHDDPAAVIELGGAASRSLKGGAVSFGPDLAIEVTPVENWLELEVGTTPLFKRHSLEWDTGLLFKKPWAFSDKLEFMAGFGPEWVHAREAGLTKNSPGVEVILDFMFWPSPKHKLGWFIEPGYDCTFGPGHECSLGISGGLLIAITKKHRPLAAIP